jgi:flagellar motility protein MotE (MotC chaperone)
MKPLMTFRKIPISSKNIMILILLLLIFKLFFAGYFVTKRWGLSFSPALSQAVAQEKSSEVKSEEISGVVNDEQDFEYLSLLDKKRSELDRKEKELTQKKEQLNKLKTEIENTLDNLAQKEEGIDKKISQLITLKESMEEAELKKLAKVFEATPPEQAGPMFDKLDVELAAKILFRMKGRNAGKIWGYVDPDQAVRISRELSNMQ